MDETGATVSETMHVLTYFLFVLLFIKGRQPRWILGSIKYCCIAALYFWMCQTVTKTDFIFLSCFSQIQEGQKGEEEEEEEKEEDEGDGEGWTKFRQQQ